MHEVLVVMGGSRGQGVARLRARGAGAQAQTEFLAAATERADTHCGGAFHPAQPGVVAHGDYSETHSNGGPSFQFRDVNITNDLKLTGKVPDTIGVGTNVRVIARVGSFKDPLFQLEPVSTRVC